jgi:hypothetical protein
MVSRYRDIIESNQPYLSRQTSVVSTTPSSIRNGMNAKLLIFLRNIFFLGSTSEANTDTASVNGMTSITAPINNNGVRSFVRLIMFY